MRQEHGGKRNGVLSDKMYLLYGNDPHGGQMCETCV